MMGLMSQLKGRASFKEYCLKSLLNCFHESKSRIFAVNWEEVVL